MEEGNLKKTSIIVLIYSILGAGIINFFLWLNIAMPVVTFGGGNVLAYFLLGVFTITLLAGFISSLIGGIALATNKQWGKKPVLFSMVVSMINILFFILILLPGVIRHGFMTRLSMQRAIILLSYLLILIPLFRDIASGRSINFKKWVIIGIIIACSVPSLFYISRTFKMIKPQKSSIDDNSSLSTANGKVIFSLKGNIYTVSLDGNDLKQLTFSSLSEKNPQFSQDGKIICFTRKKPNQQYAYNELFVLDGDGKNERQVFKKQEEYLIRDPSFSPDGQKIIFLNDLMGSKADSGLYEVNIDGTGFRGLGEFLGRSTYSSDGRNIYGNYFGSEVIKINLDTLDKAVVAKFPFEAFEEVVSSDSKKIAFISVPKENLSSEGGYQYQIHISDIDGSNVRQLTNDPGPKHQPTFTSDGSKIIFIHKVGDNRSIKIMNIDGSDVRLLFNEQK